MNELILKTNSDLKEGPKSITVILGLCFLLADWLSFIKGDKFEIGNPRLRGWNDFGCR